MPPEAGSREVLGLLENKISEDAFSYYQRLGRVQDYVRVHYSAPITLADAARVAGLERTYFSKFFHQKTPMMLKKRLRPC